MLLASLVRGPNLLMELDDEFESIYIIRWLQN